MTRKTEYSDKLWIEATRLLPGGVNSPVRAFRGVGGTPFFTQRAKGSRLWDVDGNEYIDYVGSWGPMILGHAHPRVVRAVQEAARDGTSFGTPNPREIRLARLVGEAFPSIQKLRFVNSGTEATMSAIRLARGFTRRDQIVKFEGCYHGHADALLVKAGSGGATFDVPDSAGVPADFARHTLTLPLNNFDALASVNWRAIAAAIIEPVPANMGLIPLKPGFLERLRQLTQEAGALLILDEVISGFRVARGGAQELFGVRADLTTLGKIIGGGLPVGAFGGLAEIMDGLAPGGPVYQAGTLSGNPLAMAAGIATLEELFGVKTVAAGAHLAAAAGVASAVPSRAVRRNTPVRWGQRTLHQPASPPRSPPAATSYGKLDQLTAHLCAEWSRIVPGRHQRLGSLFGTFFTEREVVDYATAKTSDTQRYAKFFHALLERGVYLAPSQFEVGFVSLAHTEEDLEATLRAAKEAVRGL